MAIELWEADDMLLLLYDLCLNGDKQLSSDENIDIEVSSQLLALEFDLLRKGDKGDKVAVSWYWLPEYKLELV